VPAISAMAKGREIIRSFFAKPGAGVGLPFGLVIKGDKPWFPSAPLMYGDHPLGPKATGSLGLIFANKNEYSDFNLRRYPPLIFFRPAAF